MHKAVKSFIQDIKANYPEFFRNVRVLDCGSLDINGSNRQSFEDSAYTGIDIVNGPNVDVVTHVHDFKPPALFDVVISTEMLEHDENAQESLGKMFKFLKPGGLMIITAAGFGRGEHGTAGHHPKDSPLTHGYYFNVDPCLFFESLPMKAFQSWAISQLDTDIRFFGRKRLS
ncbi:MAG: methyltransferase domain-containing protein [Bacteroidia bacterium]|nr:methyltransferase domain-containing protein [Bacteroidia bacterium]